MTPYLFLTGLAFLAMTLADPRMPLSSSACQQACSELYTIFGTSRLHFSNHDNVTFWDAKQQEVHPSCRVEPTTASEVSVVLGVLIENWCRFAVKGGGHSRNPDDSNSVGGVTIDLGRMSSVDVAYDRTRARVGGGAQSSQVYRALEEYGLGYVGGRVGTVGFGGHALGGGTSPFSNKHGWLLDNILEYEVVLSNQTIVIASEHTHPDLYWALRGGGNNFGIVTAFVVTVFPQGPIYMASTSYTDEQTDQVLDRVLDLWTDPQLSADPDQAYDMYYTINTTTNKVTLRGNQRYLSHTTNVTVFRDIDQVPAVSRVTRVGRMSQLAADPLLGVTRNLFGTLTVSPSREFLIRALEIFKEEVAAASSVEGLIPNFIVYPIHRNALAAMDRRGGNALGITKRDEPLLLIFLSTAWTNARGDSRVWDLTRNVVSRAQSVAEDLGVANRFKYMNYAWAGQANEIFDGYGEANGKRLREVQQAVDPGAVFTLRGLWRGFMKLH